MENALIGLLIFTQLICIIIYFNDGLDDRALIRSKNILATACNSTKFNDIPRKWYYTKGKGSCSVVDTFIYDNKTRDKLHEIVYAIEISLTKDEIDYSRWQENFIGILNFDIIYQNHIEISSKSPIVFDMEVAYKDKGDDDDAWKYYTSLRGQKTLECSICSKRKHYNYDCIPLSLFDFYLFNHDYYLLNIRFPIDKNKGKINEILSQMTDLWLKVITRSSNLTKYLIAIKAIFFWLISLVVIWYWRQIQLSSKPATLLQHILLVLAATLLLMNIPLEYLTLYWDIPVLSFINVIRQGIFIIAMLSFLLFFVHHLAISDYYHTNHLKLYYQLYLGVVTICYLTLFILDIIVAEILARIYVFFILYMIQKILIKVNNERRVLPILNIIRRLNCEDVICRFRYLLLTTSLCALLTIGGSIFEQIVNRQRKWEEDYKWENNTAFFIGIYSMWNIYIITLLCIYAPYRKKNDQYNKYINSLLS